MKKKILVGIIVFMMLFQFVNAWEEVFDAEAGFNVDVSGGFWNVRTFYSNYTRLFYSFFNYDRRPGGWDSGYCTSVDGITWSDFTFDVMGITENTYETIKGDKWDFYLEPNGIYLHYARMDSTPSPNRIYYGKMELLMNGSIIYANGTTEQTVLDALLPGNYYIQTSVNVVADNESRPYITGEFTTGVFDESFLLTCDQNNGTWASHTVEAFQTVYGNVVDEYFFADLVPTGDGRTESGVGRGVHWIVYFDTAVGAPFQMRHMTGVDYKDGNGWTWQAPTAMNDNEAQWTYSTWDVGYSGNYTILFKQVEDIVAPDRINLHYMIREGVNAWENETVVGFYELGDARNDVRFTPLVAMDENKDAIFAWTIVLPAGNHSWWYRRGNINNQSWQTEITEWEDTTFMAENQGSGHGWSDQGFLPPNVPISIHIGDHTDDNVYHNYLFTEDNGELILPASHLNTTLYDSTGEIADDWIFEGEVYDLVSYVDNATSFYVNTTDSRHEIYFNWNNETEQMWIDVDPNDQFTIGLAHTEYERTGNVTRLLWRFIPDRNIIDCEEEAWAFYIENSDMDFNHTGTLGFETNIYNLGGFTYYDFQGDGNRTIGGHPFELGATNGTEGSSARAEQIYRKLQHIHFLIEIDMDNEWDGAAGEFDIDPGVGFVDIGIDYRLNGTWVDGFFVRLYVQSAEVGHDNAGTDENYVEWSVDWYNYDPTTGTQQNLRSGLIYSNHWGYDNENLDPDYHNRTSSQLWVDLWFDRTNASTTVAGQVNSMYYGMKEHGASWWPGYGDFQPMRGDYENAMFLDDLYDEGGNVTDSMKFDLMRVYVEVGKTAHADGDDEYWTIRAIENVNRKLADDRMQGIEQPSFEETLVLEMPMFQSLNPIIRAIDGISHSIWLGALNFQKILWGAMDSFFAWAGFGEGFFSRITTFLMTLPEIFIAFMEFMPELLIEMAEIIEAVFAALVLMIPLYTISIGTMIETIMDYWHILTQLLNGQLLPFDIIQDIQLADWINAGITMLPTYEVFGIIFDDDPGRRAEQRMKFYSSIFGGLIGFLKDMASFMSQVIQTIMDILPG